jgi:hypothetical protein
MDSTIGFGKEAGLAGPVAVGAVQQVAERLLPFHQLKLRGDKPRRSLVSRGFFAVFFSLHVAPISYNQL